MLDCGIVLLLNADPTVSGIVPNGGYPFGQLPKNVCLPNWSYRFMGGRSMITLETSKGYRWRRLEIAVYSTTPNAAVNLANAINWALEGFTGLLPEGTMIDSIFTTNYPLDFFDTGTQTYRRLLEYQVNFYPSAQGE